MSVLVAKEVRLLLPAWAAGLLLAFVPLWIMPPVLAIAVFAIGALMVGLSAFGREFGMKTFPLILAQPLERRSLWRTKTTVLAIAMTSIFLALWLAAAATGIKDLGHDNLMVTGSVIAMTTFAGGLWTTLLLRQVASAFWFCVLVPSVIQMIVTACGGSEMVGIASLAVYSIAAFLWARRYFFRMQEAGWTGGEISIAGWADRDSTDANSRSFRPFMALCWKEVQLHQFNLFGIGLLFLLHVGVIGLRKLTLDSSVTAARAGLHVFGGIWFIVPLLVASTSIAEER